MINSDLKLFAFDMDGTFLTDNKQFNRPLFQKVVQQVNRQGGHMVVASGDPLECLLRYFPEEKDQITIIAENGAQIMDDGQEILAKTLDPQLAHEVVNYLIHSMNIEPVISGHKQGYFPPNATKETIDHLAFYYPTYTIVDNFDHLPHDEFFQLSFLVEDDDVPNLQKKLDHQFGDRLVITPSGNGSMDLTNPGINKGWAVQKLLHRWHLTPNQLVVFGDGGNDVSMLKLTDHSYVMPNGGSLATRAAKQVALADNNHDGVLKTIVQLLSIK